MQFINKENFIIFRFLVDREMESIYNENIKKGGILWINR